MTTFFLIRHGETEWNREGRIQGFRDSPLTAAGRRQAECLRERLGRRPVAAAYASDAKRCVDTARAALSGTDVRLLTLHQLRERNLGAWEGRLYSELKRESPESIEAYRRDAAFRPPDGETFIEMQTRVYGWFERAAAAAPATSAIFTSGGSIRAIVIAAMRADPDAWSNWSTWNAGVTELERRGDRWRLVRFNDFSHLDGSPDTAASV